MSAGTRSKKSKLNAEKPPNFELANMLNGSNAFIYRLNAAMLVF